MTRTGFDKIKRYIRRLDQIVLGGGLRRLYTGWKRRAQKEPVRAADAPRSQREEFFRDEDLRRQLACVDPRRLTDSGRLDVIVRYLLFRDIAFGNESAVHKSLYCRTILSRSGGREPMDFYSENEKRGMDEHLRAARELCESMMTNGFQKESYIPVAEDLGLYNGAHRLAAAMALDEKVWIRVCGARGVRDMDFDWFCENGFSEDDKLRILRGFADLHQDCGLFILYGACMEKWNYVTAYIGKRLKIVGAVDLDFSKDYVAFENLIHEIYGDYDEQSLIQRKIDLLKFSKLMIRVILVSDEFKPDQDLYGEIRAVKARLRKLLCCDYAEEAYITLHASDHRAEFDELKRVVLSVNNLKHLGMRMRSEVRPEFRTWLEEFKTYAREHGIPVDAACIVGSSPLEAVGIRESTDIDIVVATELRRAYGDGVTHLTPCLDIVTKNYVRDEENVLISDEQLIYDDNCHFMLLGCKFANVDYVNFRKSSSHREKDIRDVKLIKLYTDYYRHFEDKKILQEQIQKELERRKSRK